MTRTYATLTIEASFYDDPDEPLTQAEVDELAASSSNWESWTLLEVSELRRG